MRSVLLASLRIHARRYIAAAGAVVVAVVFIVVVGVLNAGTRAGLRDGVGAPFRDADWVITGVTTAEAIAYSVQHGTNAAPLGHAFLSVTQGDERFPAQPVGSVAAAPELRWQTLVAGRFPERAGEVIVDAWGVQELDLSIGDHITIDGDDVEVVGIAASPSTLGQASLFVTFDQLLAWRDAPTLSLESIAVLGDPGELPEGATVRTPDQQIAEELAKRTGGVDTLTVMLLVFAAVAVFVSILVITNTFSILFTQRLRDFALLRCVGATRRQVLGSVRREAATIGVTASLAGVLVGVGLGYGLIHLIRTVAPRSSPLAFPTLPLGWMIAGLAVGVVVTLVASWLPARRVVRVSPLAALRADAVGDGRTGAGRRRVVLAAMLLVAGAVLLGVAVLQHSVPIMLTGGAAVFAGVILLGPVLVPLVARAVGVLFGRVGRLATANAVRHPQRAATTTASLLVGVTLTTAVLTGLATTRASVDANHGVVHPIDVSITSWDAPIGTETLNEVLGTPGVAEAIAVAGVLVAVDGRDQPLLLLGTSQAAVVARDGGAFASVAPGTIRVDREAYGDDPAAHFGEEVTVRAGDAQARVAVTAGVGWGSAGIVAPETLVALSEDRRVHAIWIRAVTDADPIALLDALDTVASSIGAELHDGLQAEAADRQQLAIVTGAVLGLLAISVLIALIGIANTLGLSVLERTREHALLRGLGLSRRGLRRMLAVEAMLLSVVATLLGTSLGIAFAWAAYETFITRALSHATALRIPWLQLGVVVLVAGLAGLLASIVPSRRAARVTPAAGLWR